MRAGVAKNSGHKGYAAVKETTDESLPGARRTSRGRLGPLAMAWLLGSAALPASAQSTPAAELAELSLEELAETPVTSVFRRAEPLSSAPTSIFVITADDVRRSGATSLAEALRLAPNLQVARVTSKTYAITARGFNNAIGNKLLVLIDGRTVYSPLFSGVFWDQQDVVLGDIERIEVISGPGATQWGANAVNGVINVITRNAASTQGPMVSLYGGDTEDGAVARYGGRIGENVTYRLYAKGVDREETRHLNGDTAGDAWQRKQAGFRIDWTGASDEVTLQGDAYDGRGEATALGRASISGSNVLARWTRRLDTASDLRVQAYLDNAQRDDLVTFRDRMRVYDVEAQYGAALGAHKLMVGGGYRWAHDETQPSLLIRFIPEERNLHWANVFVQDTVRLSEQVEATAGVKLESNIYTGWEVLPSARIAWKLAERHLAWGAISRAVRAPARLDKDFFFPGAPPFFINGGPDFVSEIATVTEVGYRGTPTRWSSLSLSVFHNKYDKLRSGQLPPAVVQNMIDGNATGVEIWGSLQPTPAWRLTAGFNALNQRLRVKPGSGDPTGPSALGNDPRRQYSLRSQYTLSPGIELDLAVRRVGALPDPAVPAYTALDARIGWQINRAWELSLTVQNASDPSHPEFDPPATGSHIPRATFLRLTWKP